MRAMRKAGSPHGERRSGQLDSSAGPKNPLGSPLNIPISIASLALGWSADSSSPKPRLSASQVTTTAEKIRGTPYDVDGATFGHVGDQCSFDAIIRLYDIHDPALDRLAKIVRGADTSSPQLTPQCEGLLAISYGLSANFWGDHEMLKHGMVMYDALYTWCRLELAKPSAG